ncbi:hypothetical protein HAX54_017849, partial [Datura stramonium]|nr:hypothetical protein [Datura stramonium]
MIGEGEKRESTEREMKGSVVVSLLARWTEQRAAWFGSWRDRLLLCGHFAGAVVGDATDGGRCRAVEKKGGE